MNTVLETRGLTKVYGRVTAVNNLNLKIEEGSVFGILGPNGSGKTTTLGMILDVINKTRGDFYWFNLPSSKENRKEIGAILETPIFYPYMSAAKNLEIVADIKGVSYDRIEAVLKMVNLYERKNDDFSTYSLGMKQRLSLASALLCDPKVLVLDEPTNGLDPQGIAEIRSLITDIAKRGKTIILASHLLDEVQKVCTHFCVMKSGNLLHSGRVDEMNENTISVEVASADMNRLREVVVDCPGFVRVEDAEHVLTVVISKDVAPQNLNTFLFEQGVVVNHLMVIKKSLEKQFLQLLAESDNA